MFSDKKPSKYVILGLLLITILIGLLVFFGMQAKAAERFLPIQEVKTPSGITIWLVEDHSLPVIATKFLFVESGTTLDPQEKQGLARMLSNTMDEGAGDLDSQAFQQALNDHSITLAFNAARDGFGGELKTLTRQKDKAFELLGLALNSPRFDKEAVDRMRDSNLTRLRSSMTEPEWMSARLVNDRIYDGHPYSKNSGGTLSSLKTITPEDLRKFQKSYLTRDRLLVTVTGDITPEDVSAQVDRVFSTLPEKAPASETKDTDIMNQGKVYLFEQNIPQTLIEVVLPGFGREDPDYFALQILNHVYGGGGFGSRLMDDIREKRGLTYGIYSNVATFRHSKSISISTSTKNESAAEVLRMIKQSMTKMQSHPVSEKELKDAKSYIIGSMPLALSSTTAIAGMMLGIREDELPSDYLDTLSAKIEAVTLEDLQRVAKRVLDPEKTVVIMVGKPQNIENAERVEILPNVE